MFQFTHPGKGATTSSSNASGRRARGFNSRTLGRVRQMSPYDLVKLLYEFQFTHPGKGATQPLNTAAFVRMFQFTHPGKGATRYSKLSDDRVKFQFTHPGKGATDVKETGDTIHVSFNSRTLGRVRQCGAKLRIIGRINKRNLRLGVLS